jgi:hypothetical protein
MVAPADGVSFDGARQFKVRGDTRLLRPDTVVVNQKRGGGKIQNRKCSQGNAARRSAGKIISFFLKDFAARRVFIGVRQEVPGGFDASFVQGQWAG